MKRENIKQDITVSKVIGIQFSIPSPDEIRRSSVAEITNRDTYINNRPVIGGLFDPRMGVLEPGLVCPTDGLDYIQTPGYFGHIELARPVFYIQYLLTVKKILKCVCFKCSKLLISKHKNKELLNYSGEARWKQIVELCGKITRCGGETEDGCGCINPVKIKREGLSTLTAEWKRKDPQAEFQTLKINAEIALKILRRISDEDVTFMGFNATFSRPDWMICQVLQVSPPAMRPSVKHDEQQRSEDDLTHILVNIIKANKTLQDKIQSNAPATLIDDWTSVLQYYIATQIDNRLPGVGPVAQRSGRALKSIKDRLERKGGRMRGNLMAKRVDFSARSVITADPNLSIEELGIPLKIAKNLTKPETVNKLNRQFLTKLVRNGPDTYPGAKLLQKKNGESITLKYYMDRESMQLDEGDIVHRHIMDGDVVLFNRQPSLHRMSMMAHIARVLMFGDTFRMNVADTKPYNADFDGDEMNMHMPQDPEADAELKFLAAVPYQIISPANNSSIIGIYQDSMLGAYLISRPSVEFSPMVAMELLAMFNRIKTTQTLTDTPTIKSTDVISQIFPPLTIKGKVNIHAGKYLSGQIDKGVLGGRSRGLLQRICNDFGNHASASFINDLQNVVNEYMKGAGFSVGISDLISDAATNEEIVRVISKKKTEVQTLIQQIQMGIFENTSGKTNEEEFETRVNSILNQATSEAGKIGLDNLSEGNRFVTMVKAGSKGSELNISFMISCLGQQNVDGKRIPYGFEHRTLPHFTKYDDSPVARGFVESSYINGLSPQELFMHAMGGRIGLIDTAVKTSTTGYIQRQLIKGLEDLMVNYDMTVRNSHGKVVQFQYGGDGIDTTRVEDQKIPLIGMSIQNIYDHYFVVDDKSTSMLFAKGVSARNKRHSTMFSIAMTRQVEEMVDKRDQIIKYVFEHRKDSSEYSVSCPVAFEYIINNVQNQCGIGANSMIDLTFYEAYEMLNEYYATLGTLRYCAPTPLFKVLYYYYLSPKQLLLIKRFNRHALTLLLSTIVMAYKLSIVAPGEMVGLTSAQSIGEVSTQMTLNTFHFAGVASKSNVTRGVPRINEILELTQDIKNPSLSIYLKPEDEKDKTRAQSIMHMLEHTKLRDIVRSSEVCFDPDDLNTLIKEDRETIQQFKDFEAIVKSCGMEVHEDFQSPTPHAPPPVYSKWVVRMEMDPETMLDKNITLDDVNFTLTQIYGQRIQCVFSDFNADKLVFRIRMNDEIDKPPKKTPAPLDQTDQIFVIKQLQKGLLDNVVLRGVENIQKVVLRKVMNNVVETNGVYKEGEIWVMDTVGTNLIDVLGLDYIDYRRTTSNSITEVMEVLGIEAARQTILNELSEVVEFDGTYINFHNYSVLVDRMTVSHKLISINRHGINNDNIGPVAKASFEETPEMFLKAARHATLDTMRGVSANVMCGQEGYYGTASFQVLLDMEKMRQYEESTSYVISDPEKEISDFLGAVNMGQGDPCSRQNIDIQNNVVTIRAVDMGKDTNYDPGF